MRIARWEEYPLPLRVLGWLRVVLVYIALLGFGIVYIVMGNAAGVVIGAVLVCVWVALGLDLIRKRLTKPS